MGRLRAFRTFGDFKFYLLSCTKRLKAVSRDPRIVHKYIISTSLFDESISFFCVKPLHNPFCQDYCPPFSKRSLPSFAEFHAFVPEPTSACRHGFQNARWMSPEARLERGRVCFGGFRDTSLKLWSVGDPSKHAEDPWILAHEAPQRHLISLNIFDVKIFVSNFYGWPGRLPARSDLPRRG